MRMTRRDQNYGVMIEITSEEFLERGGEAILKNVIGIVSKELSAMIINNIKSNVSIWKKRIREIMIYIIVAAAVLLIVVKFFSLQ